MQERQQNYTTTNSLQGGQPLRQRVPSNDTRAGERARSHSNPKSYNDRASSPDDHPGHNASGYGFEVNNKPLRNKSN